jgi:hypothetical protein
MDQQPEDWPYKTMQMQHYGKEVAAWSTGGQLQNIPEKFNTNYHTLSC